MKCILSFSVVVLFSLSSQAQCYDVSQRPYYPDPFTGGTSIGTLTDDVHSIPIDIGFDFCFFGNTVSQVVVASNGYLTFDMSQASQFSPWGISDSIPSSTVPLFSILAPWQDINPSLGGEIRYATYGVPPYRRFVVSYDSIPMFSCVDMRFSNQVVLYESMNVIDINIADKELCEDWNGGVAIEGIQNQDGTEGYVVPGRNFPSQWTAQYDSYRFTPTCACPTDSLLGTSIVPGKVYWDQNGNCYYDPDEILLPNVRIDVQPGNGVAWTNQNGEFGLLLDPGNYTFEHSPINSPYYVNVCNPDPIAVTVVADSNAVDVCFGDTIIPFYDVEVNVGMGWFAACFPTHGIVKVCNNGNVPVGDLDLTVQLSPYVIVDSTDLTYVSDSTWIAHIDTLGIGQCANFYVFGSILCDSVILGQVGCVSADVTLIPNEIDSINNSFNFCGNILASYDPNDKRVRAQNPEEGWLIEEEIENNDELTYMIRFQNTGTGPAYNVIIQDELSQFLDHQSIDPIMASHDNYMQMMDGELSVHFLGIELPDSTSDPLGSQGFIMFSVKQNTGNQPGTLIENQAEIFFDFNAPVATNTTVNEIPMLVSTFNESANTFSIYPNPAYQRIHLVREITNTEFNVEIMDAVGKVVFSRYYKEPNITIDLQGFDAGVYMIRITDSQNSISVQRIIKN